MKIINKFYGAQVLGLGHKEIIKYHSLDPLLLKKFLSKEGCEFSLKPIIPALDYESYFPLKESDYSNGLFYFNKKLTISGPLGTQSILIPQYIHITYDSLSVSLQGYNAKSLNLNASLIKQMIIGVTEGFKKQIKLIGIGYKIQPSRVENIDYLTFSLGFSHPITIQVPHNISISDLDKNSDPSSIDLHSTSLISLNNFVAKIFNIRPFTKSFKGTGVSIIAP